MIACRFLLIVTFGVLLAPSARALTEAELSRIGRKVWQNECGGTRDGLTSWNEGEDFGSFGIGHFIWYPKARRGPFEESFPRLIESLARSGVPVAKWMRGDCPWNSRAEFRREFHSANMNALRDLLADTIPQQSRFLAERMQAALPKMLEAAPRAERENIGHQFDRLASSADGTFALIDYVNFKGEGTSKSERYRGEGWGLLQVLAGMHGSGANAVSEFSRSAVAVLERRVKNSPPARNEAKWLPGWKNRVQAYAK